MRSDEKRFFSPRNMPVIKAKVPVQYTGLDGIGPKVDELGAHNRGTTMSSYYGGSHTSRYRQIDIGYGQRSDFTTKNIKDKAEANYDFEKFGSMRYALEVKKSKSTKKNDTFYSSFKQHHKSVVPTCLRHYYGNGVSNHNGLGPQELDTIQNRTMRSTALVPKRTDDRGLHAFSNKQM